MARKASSEEVLYTTHVVCHSSRDYLTSGVSKVGNKEACLNPALPGHTARLATQPIRGRSGFLQYTDLNQSEYPCDCCSNRCVLPVTAVLTQSGALVLRRLMASPFGRRVYDLVSRTVSFVRAHPYLVLAALTVLIAGEIWLAHARLAPVNLEWAQGWLFFLSIVAWSGMTCLIGVTTPLRWTHPWYVIPLLLVGPPVIIIGALRALYAFTLPDSLSSSFSYPDSFTGSLSYEDTAPYVVAAILFWLVGSILIALATISVKVTKSYAALVIYPLMAVGLAFLSALRFAPLWYMPEMDLDDIVDLVALFYFAQLAVHLAIVLPVLTGISCSARFSSAETGTFGYTFRPRSYP